LAGAIATAALIVPLRGQSADATGSTALGRGDSSDAAGAVYVMTNDPTGNSVIHFQRSSSGRLRFVDEVATSGRGGTGNGVGDVDPLGSQNSLVLTDDGNGLLAVNAGSNELSLLDVDARGRSGRTRLRLVNTVRSGGTFPNSVAQAGHRVYVLNARETPNVSGFTIDRDGLRRLPRSTRNLPGGRAAAPHDVRFSPDTTRLVVTEDGTNQIDVFDVDRHGLLTSAATTPSSGPSPFGFAFTRRAVMVVTEAAAGAVSSYQLNHLNTLDLIDPSVANGQMATCWIAITGNGEAFISNTASSTLSSYQVAPDGNLTLVRAVAANTGSGSAPIDLALTGDGKFLYVLDSAQGRVLIFAVSGTALARIGAVSGLPTTLQGIVAQ
jgi:6-phosphogluconolactonase (cycloisomerase 2 family)